MHNISLRVVGMSCMGCVNSVKNLLAAVSGVSQVEVELDAGLAHIVYDPLQTSPDALRRAIEDGGYQAPIDK